MQASTVHPVTNFTTTAQNTTTKSPQQILIQSGAIIAIIVIAIIIILAILLIILKTYNTHAARILTGSSNNQRKNTSAHSNMVMGNIRGNSGLGSFAQSTAPPENGFHLPRVDLGTVNHLGTADQRPIEQFSTTSGSTVVTIHDTPSVGNT
uniref:Si:dkey-221l4.10 n=1 Tax=Astyanax mexicanus TaxID=7994 RepID=A0A3B1J652_ASTMX